jgi:hypothetical protein
MSSSTKFEVVLHSNNYLNSDISVIFEVHFKKSSNVEFIRIYDHKKGNL